jgi:hypothetical protein
MFPTALIPNTGRPVPPPAPAEGEHFAGSESAYAGAATDYAGAE